MTVAPPTVATSPRGTRFWSTALRLTPAETVPDGRAMPVRPPLEGCRVAWSNGTALATWRTGPDVGAPPEENLQLHLSDRRARD